ncbi:hypothetical protein GZH47_31545 (plasmid) [Paenibacillus rhizovicinus]|uniref:Uncharacterized protein n=1 Tax=Paenibacillus rhizovicinus TaxID=2704463 RepID=A0A6C0PAN1_9BACL|nr:type II secretion system F family protein [Paenibacillus rhizovicinus]QHW35435.1 hypothetical protein GZH47_31545 [Paenibacillus rhizovicinus]
MEPIVGRLLVGFMVIRRNRFYDKRKNNGRLENVPTKSIFDHPVIKKLDEYMSIAEIKTPAKYLLSICMIILLLLFIVSNKLMPAPLYNLIIGVLFGTIPLLWVWSRHQKKTLAMAKVMIPTVQNFIGFFTDAENLENAIYKSARTIEPEIANEWNRLIMDLQTGEKPEKALIQFAERVGNDWAHYFADILITHIDTGVNITASLFKLISEMQNSEYNEEKRITLLTTYKWGTFIMIALSVFVVYFNIKMDPANYRYYFLTASGVHIVTLSVIVLFISFLGAMHMGRKKL